MKHTPAPWKVDTSTENTLTIVAPWGEDVKPGDTPLYADYRGGIVCKIEFNAGVPTKAQAEANARLIATAPDYFAIVDAILEDKDLTADHIRNMLRPAHAKAKGD